jgi:hypothetical protein
MWQRRGSKNAIFSIASVKELSPDKSEEYTSQTLDQFCNRKADYLG